LNRLKAHGARKHRASLLQCNKIIRFRVDYITTEDHKVGHGRHPQRAARFRNMRLAIVAVPPAAGGIVSILHRASGV
jgi:hypothetical protein